MNVLVFFGCCNEVTQIEWLNRNLLSYSSGSLEVQDQIIGGSCSFPLEVLGKNLFQLSLLVSDGLLALLAPRSVPSCPHDILPMCIFTQIPFYMGISLLGLGVTLLQYDLTLTKLIASATAKSLQSCPTLCDPIDGSPPGSSVLGILQARTLEWVAISFSNA